MSIFTAVMRNHGTLQKSQRLWICDFRTTILIVNTPLRHLVMACIHKGFHSFACTPHVYSLTINHTCLCLPSRSWSSFTNPGGMEGWVGWARRGTRTHVL